MRPIPDIAVEFVAAHEGYSATAYPDPATGGDPWTIGYGRAHDVKKGDKTTKAQAKVWLKEDMQVAVRKLESVLKTDVIAGLTEHQWAALISFAYNVGARPGWTLWKRINAKQWDQVPGELMKFTNANGNRLQGLVNRRADEIKLWSEGDPNTANAPAPPSAVTRLEGATPPTPSDPIPASKSSTLIGGAVGAVATIPVAAQQITAAVAPYADRSEHIQKVIAVLATIAAIAAVVVLALNYIRKREARS